jgi:hypothetical protein
MEKNLKALIRRELITDLIECDFNQDQLENYLKTDLEKLPSEWAGNGDGTSNKAMDEYLDEKFPKEEETES